MSDLSYDSHPAAASSQRPPTPHLPMPQLPVTQLSKSQLPPTQPPTPQPPTPQPPTPQLPTPPITPRTLRTPRENVRVDSIKSWDAVFADDTDSRSHLVLQSSSQVSERNHAIIDSSNLQVDFEDVGKRIGVGTYGSVYVGCYHGELVAVKRIRMPEVSVAMRKDKSVQARRKEALRQFAREIRRYERISHPGIVHFLGVTLPDNETSALIVTALMRGGSLGEALASLRDTRTPIDLSSMVRISLQACGGLRALHSANCTWGDAKPDNILLSAPLEHDGKFPLLAEARISDFGLSRCVGQSLLTDTTVAGTGDPAGTSNYMAPEAFVGIDREKEDIAKASDVFSFGMVMYEMLTLRTPWKGRDLFEVCSIVAKGGRPDWPKASDSDYYREVPADLRQLVESCWAHNPLDRPTADDIFQRLDETASSMSMRGGQRPVSDLGNPMLDNDFNRMPSPGISLSLSKRSNASTAVAICDESVELSTSELQGSRDSDMFLDEAGQAVALRSNGSVDSISSASTDPRVSPVSSLDPQSLKEPGSSNMHAILLQTNTLHQTKSASTDASETASAVITAVKSGLISSSQGAFCAADKRTLAWKPHELHDESDEVSKPQNPDEEIFDGFMQEDLHAVPTTEFIHYRDQLAQKFAEAAIQLSNIDDSDPVSNGAKYVTERPARREEHNISQDKSRAQSGSQVEDETPTNPSPAALRRKRSKRLQSIIEHAAMAFLELQRREEKTNRTPPKLRKEAAEKKAVEEARQLSEHETLRVIDRAQSLGNYSLILETLKGHRTSHVIAKTACSYLEPFCRAEALYYDVCEEGGVEEFISAVSLFGKQDAALCTVFCNSMTALSTHFDDKVGHLIRGVGVPYMVIEVLELHKTDIPLQTAGCSCLAAIAGSSELSRSAVATLGGPGAVYRAITKNNSSFKDVELAKASLKAVRHIAHDNRKAAEYLVEVAALDPVSKAADVFTDHGLEQDILDALQAFSFYNCGRRNIIMSSGLKALTAIMLRNKDPRFLVQCCTFIRAIARWRDHECEDAMLQSSISERITSLMHMSNDIPGEEGARVAWYACHACTFLASFGARSRQRLRRVGAIETVLEVMAKRKENYRVVHNATDAIAELIKNEPESIALAEEHDVITLLQIMLELHHSVSQVRNALLWTLDYIASPKGRPIGPAEGSHAYQEMMRKLHAKYGHKPPPQSHQKRRFFWMGRKKNQHT